MKFLKVVVFVLLAVVLVACGGDGEVSFSTANIQNARLASDEAGEDLKTVFAQDDTIYVLADLRNAPDGTTVRAAFTAVSADGEEPNTHIEEVDLTTGSGTVTFNLSPNGLWPNGNYKVDLFLNDELNQTLDYTVEGPVEAASEEPAEVVVEEPAEVVEEIVEEVAMAGTIATVEDARQAVIQIQAEGTFVEPDGVAFNAAGRGSGFIIDESGLAVTNNHVVTGAALVKVWLDGENEPRNARIVASSECSDLALIDIDGDGFPYFNWYDGDSKVGNEVYVAGFPLGDPEYTLTRGIISKENAGGESNWASVDHVLEYDAQAAGGNSGGPVINTNAEVVAVHYASSLQTDDQSFGISSEIAQSVVAQMMEGNDVHSIGINGRAIINEDGSIFGIWVSSVKSGSPADDAGIRPGDLLRQLEGLVLATDGTMADYCDILRSRSPEDTMSFSLWRLNTGEVLEGQLNGRVAEVVSTLGGGEEPASNNSSNSAATTASGNYMTVNDDSGQLAVNVPVEWSQVNGGAWVNDSGENLGIRVIAAADVNGYLNSWSVAGLDFRASSSLSVDDKQLIDSIDLSEQCEYGGRETYSDQVYTGQYDIWANCGDAGSTFVVLTAVPQDASYVVLLETVLISESDFNAFQEILNSFIVQ